MKRYTLNKGIIGLILLVGLIAQPFSSASSAHAQQAPTFNDTVFQMSQDSAAWKAAMEYWYLGGPAVGVGAGVAAYGIAAGFSALSVQYLGGWGTGCLAFCSSVIQRAPSYAEQGYQSFEAFKSAVGKADPSGQNLRQWHHIVEQNSTNVERFGQQAIQNGQNIVNIPTEMHQRITGYYNKAIFPGGPTFRESLFGKSFEELTKIGNEILQKAVSGTL